MSHHSFKLTSCRPVFCMVQILVAALLPLTVAGGEPGWDDAVWQNLNPGAGGNIQSIDLDPNTPGRVYLSSDMEGCYRSDDFGASWRYLGRDLRDSYVNAIAVEPGRPERVYSGTVTGLEISDNAGEHWRAAVGVRDTIGQIAIDPENPSLVLALPGERHRWGVRPWDRRRFEEDGHGPWGERNLYVSRDRGETWSELVFEKEPGRRDILSADFAPAPAFLSPGSDDSAAVYLGTLTGVYVGTEQAHTWTTVPNPPNVGDCLGATVTPDGRTLYAVFRVPSNGQPAIVTSDHIRPLAAQGHSHLFAARLDVDKAALRWHDLSESAEGFVYSEKSGRTLYWRPRLDPCSADLSHRLLVGTFRPQHGLWEVSTDWADETPEPRWRPVLWYDYDDTDVDDTLPWDRGWEIWGINAEDYYFTPPGWGEPHVFTTGGQTLYRALATDPDYQDEWNPIYTRRVGELEGEALYRTRGFQSVFVFDATAHGDYVAQAVADNCLLESFDGGYSWSMRTKPGGRTTSRSNSVRVVPTASGPIVVAHVAIGWGANAQTGTLWAKRLKHFSPRDEWVPIAGGEEERSGLPNVKFNAITADPHRPGQVYVPTFGRGVYVIDDLEGLMEAAERGTEPPAVRQVAQGGPTHVWYTSQGFAVDPRTPDVLWSCDNPHERGGALWRGERQLDGRFAWTRVNDDTMDGSFTVWQHPSGTVMLVAPQRDDTGRYGLSISTDDGQTWKPLLDFSDVVGLRENAWYHDGLTLRPAGLLGFGDRLVFSFVTDAAEGRRTYGLFHAVIDEAGSVVSTSDWTADHPWPYPVTLRQVEQESGAHEVYLATRGTGLWRRTLGKSASTP